MKHLISTLIALSALSLVACDKSATEHNLAPLGEPTPTAQYDTPAHNPNAHNPHDLKALANELGKDSDTSDIEVKPITTQDGKIQIDWSLIDTKEPKADVATYAYPIALDSQAVKNYAAAHHISDKQAQHSIVVGMASPEVLGKILDQLKNGEYLSHHLTDGADMTLVITTTPNVVGERHDYVFADNFGRGLVLPVVIEPKKP